MCRGCSKKLLCIHVRRAKRLLRFAPGRLVSSQKFILLAHHAHPAPRRPPRSLENQRIPYPPRLFGQLLFPFNDALAPRDRGQAGGLHLPPRAVLFPPSSR